MPKTNIDYSKGIIYKIQHSEIEELLYVGSTTDFTRRKSEHKSRCNTAHNSEYNLRLYRMIRENGGWDCFKVLILKEYPCSNRIELLLEEDRCMRELQTTMNDRQAYNTPEQRKASLAVHRNKKHSCDCGGSYLGKHKCNHTKTKKHLNFEASKLALSQTQQTTHLGDPQ
jgi:hypothetical protein